MLGSRDLLNWRIRASASLLLLAAGTLFLVHSPPISGPWDGVYSQYAPFWISVGVSAVIVFHSRRDLPVFVIAMFSLLFALALVGVSLTWGLPYGPADPWRHLWIMKSQNDVLEANIYPLFHVYVIGVSAVTGHELTSVLTRIPALASSLGVLFALAVLSRIEVASRRYADVVLLVPGLLFGFVARPFTLAMPSILLAYWCVLAKNNGLRVRVHAIAITTFTVFVFLHPFIALVFLLIFVSDEILNLRVENTRLVSSVRGSLSTLPKPSNVSYVPVIIGTILLFHLVNSSIGGHLLQSLALSLVTPGTEGPAYQAGIASSAVSGVRAVVEAIKRGSYSILFSGISGIGIVYGLVARDMKRSTAISLVAGVGTIGLFLGLAIYSPGGVGLFRILSFAPLVSFPAVVYGLGVIEVETSRKLKILSVLGVVVLSVGLGVAFLTPAVGGIEFTANDQQVTASDWLVESDASGVIGPQTQFSIIQGRHGPETRSAVAGEVEGIDSSTYPWLESEANRGTLHVINEPTLSLARNSASEGNVRPLRCVSPFRERQGRVYNNGGVGIYMRSVPNSVGCGG